MKRLLMCVAAAVGLVGCGSDAEELRQWMEQQRKEAKPSVTPLLPPQPAPLVEHLLPANETAAPVPLRQAA